MSYAIKECFFTLQGEGKNSGRAAVFLRFAGCNLWSGLERDRAKAICNFCDTEFVGTDGEGGGKFRTAEDLARHARAFWPGEVATHIAPFLVCTGGEPLLQLDADLIQALKAATFEIAIETNGTLEAPDGIDWICVSPKAGAEARGVKFVQKSGHELKLIYPQAGLDPADYEALDFKHFFLQPMDGEDIEANTAAAIDYCQAHPQWRLSVQMHKLVGIR